MDGVVGLLYLRRSYKTHSTAAVIFDAHKNLYVFALKGSAGIVASNVVCSVAEPKYYTLISNEFFLFVCHNSLTTKRPGSKMCVQRRLR